MGRDEREVIVVERDGGGSVKWLLLGAAVGAGLALLFAPKPGKEFRRDLGQRIKGLKDLADETLTELKMEIGAEDDEAPETEGGAYGEDAEAEPIRRPPANPKVAARQELERRLAAARARRRQPDPVDEEPVA